MNTGALSHCQNDACYKNGPCFMPQRSHSLRSTRFSHHRGMLQTFCAILISTFSLILALPASAAAQLTITPLTWNVIGLDSNDVSTGPDTFPVGARVCNTGDTAATNVVSNYVWDSANANINLLAGSPSTLSVPTLAAGECTDFYYIVQISRNSVAYDTARRYHITATADGLGTVSTPVPRELYIEHLISQNRNATLNIVYGTNPASLTSVPAGGALNLVVGQT